MKDFMDAGEYDETIICNRGTQKETYSILLKVAETATTAIKNSETTVTTALNTTADTSVASDTQTTTAVTASTDISTTENIAGADTDNTPDSDSIQHDDSNSSQAESVGFEPQATAPKAEEHKPAVTTTTSKPRQGMGVATDSVIITEPAYYTEPATEPQTEPQTEPVIEPVTEPEVVHGDGCQYFHNNFIWCCNDGNDGYPSWYTEEDKENFRYAYNEALKYITDKANAVGWGIIYVTVVQHKAKSEVCIGDPTDGDAYPNVWVLQGYNEDGDEIWVTGR